MTQQKAKKTIVRGETEKLPTLTAKIWGTRGSLPAPMSPTALETRIQDVLIDFLTWSQKKKINKEDLVNFFEGRPRHRFGGYGGHTPCVEIRSQNSQIIIDGGSGLKPLGHELMKGPCGQGKGSVHLLFTHFHWDHLIGLPFFAPLFVPGNQIHVYSVQPELKEIFQTVFKKPFFPVPLENVGSQIFYHRLAARQPNIFGDLKVTPYQLDHPDPCWGFKVEKDGKVLSHCVDTEGTRVTRKALGEDLALYQGVDTLIFDAQYTIAETLEKVNWGHATAALGLEIAMREGIKRVVFMHHDPASNDEKIAMAEMQAKQYHRSLLADESAGKARSSVQWEFAYDGMQIEL